MLGGLLGELSFSALGIVGSLIILIPLIAILLMFLFGTTPRGIRLWIAAKLRERAEHRRLAAEAEADEAEDEDEEGIDEPGEEAGDTGKKKDRRAERERKRAKKEEQKRRRHEVLGRDAPAPVDAVFTEAIKPLSGIRLQRCCSPTLPQMPNQLPPVRRAAPTGAGQPVNPVQPQDTNIKLR